MFYVNFVVVFGLVLTVVVRFNFADECDPCPKSTNVGRVAAAVEHGILFPSSCPCLDPSSSVDPYVKYYYTECGSHHYYALDINNPPKDMIDKCRRKPVTILTHGYTDSVKFNKTGWLELVGEKVACVTNGIAILVDWNEIGGCNYRRTVSEIVPAVGLSIAKALTKMRIPAQNVELVGHSLGAHLMGSCGSSLHGQIRRITALDAAGPGYYRNWGLNKTCAKNVQAIHTDAGDFGLFKPVGHQDFYANIRKYFQPGCQFKQCGHAKAFQYYYASLFCENLFVGVACSHQRSPTAARSRFGIFNDGITEGLFCFDTTACYPYAVAQDHSCNPQKYAQVLNSHERRHRRKRIIYRQTCGGKNQKSC